MIVDIALQWCNVYTESVLSFVNNVKTVDGGTHVEGLKFALTRAFNAQARKSKILRDNDQNLPGDHVRNGLTAIISVKVPDSLSSCPPPPLQATQLEGVGNMSIWSLYDLLLQFVTFFWFLSSYS